MRHSLGYLFKEGLRSLWKNRSMTLSSIGVLISCLLLMGMAGLVSVNLSLTMESVEGTNVIQVYIKDTLPTLASIGIGEELRKVSNVEEMTFVPKDDALKDVINYTSKTAQTDASLFASLMGDENFMPDAYKIKLKDLSIYEETVQQIKSINGVDSVSDYSVVADKLSSIDRLVRNGSLALIALLGIVSLFIISNTIKVTMFSRRMEINIMKSVGATNGFVRIPFIVEGLIIGLTAGTISAAALYYAYNQMVSVLFSIVSFVTVIDIKPVIWGVFALYAILGMLFGVLGCGFSIGKYLNKEGEQAIV